jgi:hypothetical protein
MPTGWVKKLLIAEPTYLEPDTLLTVEPTYLQPDTLLTVEPTYLVPVTLHLNRLNWSLTHYSRTDLRGA